MESEPSDESLGYYRASLRDEQARTLETDPRATCFTNPLFWNTAVGGNTQRIALFRASLRDDREKTLYVLGNFCRLRCFSGKSGSDHEVFALCP